MHPVFKRSLIDKIIDYKRRYGQRLDSVLVTPQQMARLMSDRLRYLGTYPEEDIAFKFKSVSDKDKATGQYGAGTVLIFGGVTLSVVDESVYEETVKRDSYERVC